MSNNVIAAGDEHDRFHAGAKPQPAPELQGNEPKAKGDEFDRLHEDGPDDE